MESSVSANNEIRFLRVCHHVSNAVYPLMWQRESLYSVPPSYLKTVFPLVVGLVQWDFRHIVYCAIIKTLAPWAVFK